MKKGGKPFITGKNNAGVPVQNVEETGKYRAVTVTALVFKEDLFMMNGMVIGLRCDGTATTAKAKDILAAERVLPDQFILTRMMPR